MKAIELSRVCRTTGRDNGKILLTGDTFCVHTETRRWGTTELDICIVDNGTHNNGGYWVSDSYGNIVSLIEEQSNV